MKSSVGTGIASAVLVIAMVGASAARADEGAEESRTADDVAAELANPNAALGFLGFPLDYVLYGGTAPGASDQSSLRIGFQPNVPYPLSESTNFFLRPLIPVYLDQPVPLALGHTILRDSHDAGMPGFSGTGLQLGDISFDAAIGNTSDSGVVLAGGVVGTLPTASDDRVGLGQYLLGPELFIGRGGRWGFVGLLLTHQWDIAGDDSFETSVTGGQYFYTINLKNAWQIQAQPTFSYNHQADSGNRWTFPLGVGVSKTVVLGGTPWKFNVQYWHYLASPEAFGAADQVRVQITPVIPLPW